MQAEKVQSTSGPLSSFRQTSGDRGDLQHAVNGDGGTVDFVDDSIGFEMDLEKGHNVDPQ